MYYDAVGRPIWTTPDVPADPLPTGTVELEEGGVETKKSRAGMEVDQ